MKTLRFIRLTIIAALLVLTFVPFASVHAGGPYIEEIPLDEVQVIAAGALCPFEVTAHTQGTLRIHYWFDKQGNLARELDSYRVRWTYSANGVTLKANNGGPSHITFLSPTEMVLRYNGAYTLVARRGVLFGSAGQGYERYRLIAGDWVKVDEGFKAGNFAWDPQRFCAAFEPYP